MRQWREKFAFFYFATIFLCLADVTVAQDNYWQQTNGPYFGTIYSFSTYADTHVFAGTSHGVFRSIDNGNTWYKMDIGVSETQVNSIAINANGHIFAGTLNLGIFRSIDNGESWAEIRTGLDWRVLSLVISSDGHVFAGTARGVFRSTDNGDTWNDTHVTNSSVTSLAISPNEHIFAVATEGVYRSIDKGLNWSLISNDLTSGHISDLAIDVDGTIFAGSHRGRVFRSTDDGANWIEFNSGLSNTAVLSLAININRDLFAGTTVGIFRSVDNGTSWTTSGLNNVYVSSLAMNSSGHIFAGADGVYRSMDNGSSWISSSRGLPNTHIYELAVDPDEQLFAATLEDRVYRSNNSGLTWTSSVVQGVSSLVVHPNGQIFAGTFGFGVKRSSNAGITWSEVNSGLTNTRIYSLSINAEGDIFAGTSDGVFRSTNHGDEWVHTALSNIHVEALAIDTKDQIFAGTPNGVYRSSENGESWSRLGLSNVSVTVIAFTPNGDLFVGTSGGGIYRSNDGGETWVESNEGILNRFVWSFAVNAEGDIYAGTEEGLYHSTDRGDSWKEFINGLTYTYVRSLCVSDGGQQIYAGTWGGGVFRYGETATTIKESSKKIPYSFVLQQNYPNPFNPLTTISFSLPYASFVDLSVYNSNGQKIATLAREFRGAGHHSATWNASGFNSGIYLYRLDTGKYTETRKCVLLK